MQKEQNKDFSNGSILLSEKKMFEYVYSNILGKRKNKHQKFNQKFSSFDGNVFFEVTDIIKD